jgi:uncharacterized protein (DUF2344 family)
MTFSPALSLGVMSLGEILDVKLLEDGGPSAWLKALSDGSPDGLTFLSGRKLAEGELAVSKIIDTATYAVAFPRDAIGDATERVASALAAEALPIVRNIEGVGKKVDVRRYLRSLAWDDARAHDAIRRAGLVGDLAPLLVEVASTPQGSAKISEVVEVVFGPSMPFQAVRVSLGQCAMNESPWIASASPH